MTTARRRVSIGAAVGYLGSVIPFICTSCGSIDIDSADCGQCATATGPEGAAA